MELIGLETEITHNLKSNFSLIFFLVHSDTQVLLVNYAQ